MKFEFSKKSKLYNIKICSDILKFNYIPVSPKRKLEEYVFVVKEIPTKIQEPDLYNNAEIDEQNKSKIHFLFPKLNILIIFTLEKNEIAFKKDNPKIQKHELFTIS